VSAPDLFDHSASSTALGMRALAETAAKHATDIAALVPLARELAHRAGPDGITVSDLRLYAVQRGLLTGTETGRRLSYLGAVLKAAGLIPTGGYRRSAVGKSHGNLHRVYRAP
jgi:hypothetical protein